MKTTKTMFRIFTIADYEQEEQFLRQQHQNGWKLKKITAFGFYHFEACTPEDVVYRLDFRTKGTDWDSYFQLFSDYGWEYFSAFQEWNYFRKPANATEENPEIFSDNASKRELIRRVSRKRLIPLAVLFLCCVLPNAVQQITARSNPFGTFLFWFWMAMFVLYSVSIGYCGWRLFLLKQKYKNE